MAKVRLTKNEYKQQKDQLKMFTRYLPMLQLKKQQLQVEILGVDYRLRELAERLKKMAEEARTWLAVFGDDFPLEEHLSIDSLIVSKGNIAGVDIPVFEGIKVSVKEYDPFSTPFWVDSGLQLVYERLQLESEIEVVRQQKKLLEKELRVTTQRVNLFEKVKIPEIKANIKKIAIYLGDQQTAAVVRGKISKRKLGGVA